MARLILVRIWTDWRSVVIFIVTHPMSNLICNTHESKLHYYTDTYEVSAHHMTRYFATRGVQTGRHNWVVLPDGAEGVFGFKGDSEKCGCEGVLRHL